MFLLKTSTHFNTAAGSVAHTAYISVQALIALSGFRSSCETVAISESFCEMAAWTSSLCSR